MISDAESAVMELLWDRSPQTADELVAVLALSRQWQEPTIKTLLNRLLNKGAVRAQREGRRYLYSFVLPREQWLLEQSTGLLERCFGGRVAPLVAQFSAQGKLSAQDITELRKLIAELDDEL
jgi:predicted transcriptional regulator